MAASTGIAHGGPGGAPWTVVGAGTGPDEFETKASVFISRESEDLQLLLREVLSLRSPVFLPPAQAAVKLAAQISLAAEGALANTPTFVRLRAAVDTYSLARSEAWWEGREWRLLRKPLAECLLNHTLGMNEMLTEERGDALRKVAAARSRERIDRRFQATETMEPFRDPYEEWCKQLGDWKILLEPYPWHRARSQVMSRILTYAQLQEPLTQHVLLVRSYEFLRCLGSLLIGSEDARAKQMQMLSKHGEEFGCWVQGEVDEVVLSSYLNTVVGGDEDIIGGELQGRKDIINQLGYTPRAVQSTRQPIIVLAQLVCRLITAMNDELRDFCESHGLRGTRQACEALLQASKEVLEQSAISTDPPEQLETLRDFLVAVSVDYVRRSTLAGVCKPIQFSILAEGDPRMEQIQSLEEQAEARRLLDDMALNELTDLLKLVHQASEMVHGPGNLPPSLEPWVARLVDGNTVLHPNEIGKLSAALQEFLQQNQRACKDGKEDALLNCMVRALGTANSASREVTAESAALGSFVKQAPTAARRVVACFGTQEMHGEGLASRGPVVVRAVPLRLSGSGDDYEVREVGVRIGGMYRTVSQDKGIDDSVVGGVVVIQYEWVPPGEVREDSKPLEQILSSVTHVRIVLPEGQSTEEREVDLRTNRVHGDSAWYRAIPSRPRTSADEHGGFRRFVVEVGRGLRLPLPNGLLRVGPGTGVIETADVLTHVLSLWFSQRHSREEIGAALRQTPALRYFASTALFECFDHLAPSFMGALENHWASVLGMQVEQVPGQAPLSVVQHEAREILLELLTAKPDGRLCAVLPALHLNELCSLTEKTRHSTEFLAVERFCFESAIEKIRAFQDSTITFIIIDVTGQVSALQLGELVRHACGSIRLIFNWYHGLVPSLMVTRSLTHVIVPASIENDMNTQVTPTAYRETFALGQATLQVSQMMFKDAATLSPLAGAELLQSGPVAADGSSNAHGFCPFDWLRNLDEATQHLVVAHAWAQHEAEWRKSVPADEETKAHEALLLIVTSDESLVRWHYDSLPEGEGVRCFSLHHSDRNALIQIEALLDRAAHVHKGAEKNRASSGTRTIIVLFNIGFVAPSKLEDIIARAYLGGQRVVLVVQEPIASLRSVRVTTRRNTQYVHATTLWVRNVLKTSSSGVSGAAGLRALRLVLGQDAIPCERHATLQSALESEDMEVCSDILQACLKPGVSSDLIAGVMQVLTNSSKAGPSDSRSLAFTVGCLAAKFVQHSLKLGLDEKVWDITFPDFRSYVPICRFLDQVNVLEAWCRYLDFTGAVGVTFGGEMLPEGPVVWPRREPHNHFILSHWVPTNNAHSLGIEDMLENAAPREGQGGISIPLAMYYGTGPGHHSEAREEVIERHCLQRHEMDWAQFSESWRTALDIKPDVFLRLAAFGVDTLRLFLCLPPERAIELGLTHLLDVAGKGGTPQVEVVATVAQKLLRDLECVGPLLEVVIKKDANEVAARFAAVKWLLLTVLPERDAFSMLSGVGRIDEDTVEQLVRAKVMLAPRGRTELLRRVVAIVVGLDGGDILGTQHEIRRFLLETRMPLPELLCDAEAHVGRAIVSFLFSPDHTEQLKRREMGCAVVDSFAHMFGYDVLRWRALEDPQAVASSTPDRISAAAHTAVLERAPGPEIGQALANGPLLKAVSQLSQSEGAKKADSFLGSVLDNLPNGSDALVLAVLETLASKDSPAAKVMALLEAESGKRALRSVKNKFLPELFAALRTQDLGNYLMMVSEYKEGDADGRPLQLALDRAPSLQKLYTEHFCKMDEKYSDSLALNIHNAILDDSSCAALFTYLSNHCRKDQPSDMFLLWYCWSRSPDRQLPSWAMPCSSSRDAFTSAVNGGAISFVDRCRPINAGLSVLAKYLVAAETLPLGMYNTLAEQVPWIHSAQRSDIGVRTLLLGQEDVEEYPPYCLRWHSRALPLPLRERLLKKCHGSVGKLKDTNKHDFYPRIKEGVSEQTFKLNLGLLMTLTQDNPDLQTYFDHGAEGQRHFVGSCICAWFKAAGFDFESLYSCVKPEMQERFKILWDDMHRKFQETGQLALRRMYVRGPLPHSLDVRWIDEGVVDVPIFARTRNSALVTAQSLNMLIVHFNLRNLEPFTPEDLVQVSGANGGSLLSGPRFGSALASVSSSIGHALHRDLLADAENQKLVLSFAKGKLDNNELVSHVAVLSDFISLLRITPGNLQQFFGAMVKALASGPDGDQIEKDGANKEGALRPSEMQFGALFDSFFLLHGITPENEGCEIEELSHAYHANNLPLSSQALEEIRWLHESYYGVRDKSGVVAARLPHFKKVCERLTRVRHCKLRTVEFQRHFMQPTFVGELLVDQHSDISPPYLQQLHFQLLCSRSCATDTGPKAATIASEDSAAGMESVFGSSLAHDLEFFTATGEDGGMPRANGSMHRQWDRPEAAEVSWQHPCPVVSAPEIVEIDASESLYLHAVLRVRPGLQPILWCMDKVDGFYRINGLLGQRVHGSSDICKAFSTNADAWQFIDRAQSAVVMCDGFYLRKADDGISWLVIFPVARPPDDSALFIGELSLRHRRYCIWPLCHSHKLVNLAFNTDTLRVLQLLVWIAWHMSAPGSAGKGVPTFTYSKIFDPLRQLSALSNYVEQSIASQGLPEGDEKLVESMRQINNYQKCERHLAEVLLRIMTKMKAQQQDDLGGIIRSESQRRTESVKVPFIEEDAQNLSSLGRTLQHLLVPIVSKAAIAGSPVTTKSWTQLELVLEACYRGEQLPHERCFAKHMHITKSNFAKRGVNILHGLYESKLEGRSVPTVQLFSDSEDEDTPPKLNAKEHTPGERGKAQCSIQYFQARSDRSYVDTLMDRDVMSGTKLFDQQDGYGRPLSSRHSVLTFYDEDLPLYFVTLNRERLKIQYSASEGMCLGYLVHKNIFAELLEDAKLCGTDKKKNEDGLTMVRTLRNKLLSWITDVLRSPLPNQTKTWILRCCERMGMVAVSPYQEANHVNLAVIAYCLCRCCPSGTEAVLFLRTVLMNAWHIPEGIRVFIERKADIYGLYIAKPGTLQKMRELGLHVAVRDFEREVWQRSMNNSAMYLDIISHFSSYCCFTYVQGLPKMDDILLKWLAEYTRLHPWRFIFLEGVDTSFNFPENRDRCNFRFAPPNPLHTIKTIDDLRSPYIAEIRPSHSVPYPENLQPTPEDIQDPKRLFSFFARQLTEEGSGSKTSSLYMSPPAPSSMSSDFRAELEQYLFSLDPCLVLLVSAPGAGKTHHMGALRGRLEGEMNFDIHEFDGSSDILVTTALAEVLQRTIQTQSSDAQKLLILDEYHMLSDEHKDELFEWVRSKLGPSLRVVLIGNRIDSKDRQRLEQSRPLAGGPPLQVGLIQTRISRKRVQMVMEARGNSEKWRDHICDWIVGSRFLFGEESVSLRLCDTLEEALKRPDPRLTLVELLLHRVPTISRPTATEFVAAYLQHIGIRSGGGGVSISGLVGFCFKIAMLDRQKDELCSFVEFLERTPRAQEAVPAVRLLAWCMYMMGARNQWDISLSAAWGRRRMFVDQVNFPFELSEESMGSLCSLGPTFSWAGDPTSLRDLVDAVKRGHSVDWADVHRKVWSVEHIKDSELFAQLLSSCRNPGMILQRVLPANLCSLLRLSNTPAPTAVQLARIILKHAPHNCEGTVDRPRCLALWTILLHDRHASNVRDIVQLVGSPSSLCEALLWARDWATDRRATVSPAQRMQLLQQALALVCVQDQVAVSVQQLALLWTGSFGRLLRAPTLAEEELWEATISKSASLSAELLARSGLPSVLPLVKLRQVIQQVADVQEDWVAEVQALWRIGHSRTTAREVSSLWSVAAHLLQDASAATKGIADKSRPVHECFIHGIVTAPGTLCRSLQHALLCNHCQVPESIAPTAFATSCADALNELRNADQLSMISVGGALGQAIHRLVHEETAS